MRNLSGMHWTAAFVGAVACIACSVQSPKTAAVPRCPEDTLVKGFVRAQTVRCSWGVGEQCHFAGVAYHVGIGVARDRSRAREYFHQACVLGVQDGCVLSGVVAVELGERHRATEIVATWERSCENGSILGCHTAGMTLALDPDQLGIPKDMARGRAYLAKACAARYLTSCGAEASLVAQLQETSSYAKAQTQLVEACTLRERESCYQLAKIEFHGSFGTKDVNAAARHFWEACKLGLGRACGALAYQAARGIGGSKAPQKANELLDQACKNLQYAPACEVLRSSNYDSLAP